MANIKICDTLQIGKKTPSLDARYGPWQSKDACMDALGRDGWDTISDGLTVGIREGGEIKEYWFKGGTDIEHLVPKVFGEAATISTVTILRPWNVVDGRVDGRYASDDVCPSERAVAKELTPIKDDLNYVKNTGSQALLDIEDIQRVLGVMLDENGKISRTIIPEDILNGGGNAPAPVWDTFDVTLYVVNGIPASTTYAAAKNGSVTFYIKPNDGYRIPENYNGIVKISDNIVMVDNVTANTVLTLECEPIPTERHTVQLEVVHGSVVGSDIVEVNTGESVVFQITPNTGYDNPTDSPANNVTLQGRNVYVNNVTSNQRIVINCPIKQFRVTCLVIDGDVADESKTKTVAYGGDVSWTIVPNTGYIMPTAVTGGTVNGFTVGRQNVVNDDAIIVRCVQENAPEPSQYYISFNPNGSTSAVPEARRYTENHSILLPAAIVRSEDANFTYTFAGWKDNITEVVYDAESIYVITHDATLVAQWHAEPKSEEPITMYTISYDANGGNPTPASVRVAGGVHYVIYGAITRAADANYTYTFAGWKDSVSNTIYPAGTDILTEARNMVFVAQWNRTEISGGDEPEPSVVPSQLTMYSFSSAQTSNFTASDITTLLTKNTDTLVENRKKFHYIPCDVAITVTTKEFGEGGIVPVTIGSYDSVNHVYKIENEYIYDEQIKYQ